MYIQGKMQVHKREKGRSQTQCSISGIRCALGIVSDLRVTSLVSVACYVGHAYARILGLLQMGYPVGRPTW